MFGLRHKLTIGYLGLLGILLAVGVLGVVSLHKYRSTLERIFSENYDSAVYGQRMKAAVEAMDGIAVAEATETETASSVADLEKAVNAFDEAFAAERRNVTLPGESDLVGLLRAAWTGGGGRPSYADAVRSIDTADGRAAKLTRYRHDVRPRTVALKDAAQAVIDINVHNMGFTNGAVQASAAEATRTLYTLVAAGVVFGGVFVFLIVRSVLRQLGAVTASAREIEHGNLDLVVPVTSRDELGQLAETFNRMAARLRELRRTDRAKLVRTQRTTELALGSLPDGVAIVAPDGRVEIANTAARKLFGLQPGEAVGTAPAAAALADLVRRSMAERRTIEAKGYEGAIQIFNGQERFFLPTAVPIFDAERVLIGVTLVLADVTNLRKLDEMKSGLLSVVSHELKTPLTSMRLASHLLLEERVGPLNPKQTELVAAAKEDADRLYQIIENLLDMGRIESGRAGVEMTPAEADALVNAAIDDADAAYRDHNVALRADTTHDLPRVLVDADRLSHVFSNLLGNALKYTPAGGEVAVTAGADEQGFVRFGVRDNGAGIPPDALPHVFDRFYRVPDQKTQRGVGLGLAIAKEIVAAHGGRIWAESRVGVGTTICFTVPAVQASQELAS